MARSTALRSSRTLPGQSWTASNWQRFGRDAFDLAFELLVVVLDEELGEGGDVFGPLTQGRDGDVNDVEAEIEVLAESAFFHGLAQVFVGGGDDAQIELDVLEAAEAAEALLLDHAEEFGLEDEGNFADFIEE
jgi:hypothetical protein